MARKEAMSNITAKQLERLHSLQAERSRLEQQARSLKAEEDQIVAAVMGTMDDKDLTTAKRGDFRVTNEEKSGRVSWKNEAQKRMKPGEEPERPMVRRLILTLAGLMLLLTLPGCLKRSGSDPLAGSGEVFFDEDFEQQSYSGAIVYTGKHCPPCECLKTDLRWLHENKAWTVDFDGSNPSADFIVLSNCDGTTPRIDYIVGGEVVGTYNGYSTAAWSARKPLLSEIVSHHFRSQ